MKHFSEKYLRKIPLFYSLFGIHDSLVGMDADNEKVCIYSKYLKSIWLAWIRIRNWLVHLPYSIPVYYSSKPANSQNYERAKIFSLFIRNTSAEREDHTHDVEQMPWIYVICSSQ